MNIQQKLNLDIEQVPADSVTGAVPLSPQSTADALKHLISECRDQFVLFDLDSTLLNNRPRNARIMREFGEEQQRPLLTTATASHFEDWSVKNTLARIGVASSEVAGLAKNYEPFWKQHFFTSEYCAYDVAIPGAPEFVRAIKAAGGQVCYLTGRHEEMRAGTESSLAAQGFPIPDKSAVELIMKPAFSHADDQFKQLAIPQVQSRGQVLAAFDNEPTHINAYRSLLDDATCVHLFTDHSMRSVQLLPNIVSIRNFLC